MKNYLFLILVLTASVSVKAQQLEVVAASGDFYKNSSGSLSWTLGEAAIETLSESNYILTQGFQQSKITVTSVNELPGLDFTISVFPNPASDFLTVKVEKNDGFTGLMYHLYDINGKLLLLKQPEGNETTISLSNFNPSIYFLEVIQAKDSTDAKYCVSIFKIIKK